MIINVINAQLLHKRIRLYIFYVVQSFSTFLERIRFYMHIFINNSVLMIILATS